MALASDLAAAFSLIQQQQALEERKEERNQNLALQLLVLDINKEEKSLDRQASLIDRQLERAEKKYDIIYGELETSKQEFSELTGQLYKAPDKDSSANAVGVVNDIGGPVLDSLNQLLTDTQTETQGLMEQKADIGGQMRQARLLQDFYKGVGHDYSAGDPTKWDVEDFSEQELSEYIAQYPELEGIDQAAFYEGMKTRGAANLLGSITALNAVIDQAKTANLTADIKQLEFDTKNRNVPVAQIEADIDNIESGVHNILGSQAQDLNTSLFAPAIQASIEWVNSQDTANPEGDVALRDKKDIALRAVGASITGMYPATTDEYWAEENLRLGKLLVLGNSNYINSVKGHLKGTEDLNYLGYVDALQEIQMYAENARRELEDGLITTEQYLAYKNNLEQIVGTSLDDFSSKMDVIFQAANVTENKGKELAIKGMGDAFTEYTPTTDYDIDEDYISPNLVLPDSSTVLPDSSNILPDSTTISADSLHIPANTEVLIDDPSSLTREQELGIQAAKIRRGRPPKTQEQYAKLFKEGEPYYDPETDQWYVDQPLLDLAGGFLPIPNLNMFQDQTTSRQPVAIEPIYDDNGELIGFEPPAFLSPPSATYTGQDLIEPLIDNVGFTEEEFKSALEQYKKFEEQK